MVRQVGLVEEAMVATTAVACMVVELAVVGKSQRVTAVVVMVRA